MPVINKILLCKCNAAHILTEDNISQLTAYLNDNNITFDTADDLCKLASEKSAILKDYADEGAIIIACQPRAIRWLFNAAGVALPDSTKLLNLRNNSIESIVEELKNITTSKESARHIELPPDSPLPWFPVIDYDRCINCKQCMNFCIFGVYSINDGNIEVTNPTKCKPNCPACSRVCPAQAIIFAKYDKAPFDGSKVPESVKPKTMSAVDIFTQLKQRNSANDLKAMQDDLDIPDAVIKDLDNKKL